MRRSPTRSGRKHDRAHFHWRRGCYPVQPVIDLHTHSTVSDGSDEPEAIPELALANGCSAVALTDHDRMDGIGRARKRAGELGIEFITGVEVSCDFPVGTMHVLVYFVEPGSSALQDELLKLQNDRENRNALLIERLNQIGIDITMDDVLAEAGSGSIGRPHFAGAMVRKGIVGSIQEAFDKYMKKGGPAYISKGRIHGARVAELATRSGGVAVLAHPLSMGLDPKATESTVRELAEAGFSGIEAYYGRYSPEERLGLADLAKSVGLVATGGSDHHGTFKPDLNVGIGRGDLEVPDGVLGELRDRIPSK